MKTFWAFVLCVLGFNALGDQATIPGALIIQQGSANGLTITNSASQVGLAINGFAGQAAHLATVGAGGTNMLVVNNVGSVALKTYGSAVAPAFGFSDDANTGIYHTANADQLGIATAGSMAILAADSYIQIGRSLIYLGGTDLLLEREGAATFQLGDDAASPIDQAFKACDGLGSDKNGGSLTLRGGQATGTGGGGDVIVQTSIYTNSSGSTLRAYTTRSYDRAKPTALTDATTNLLFTVSLPAGCHVGGLLDATIFATDGTDFKSHNSAGVSFSAVNKGGTITASISESAQLETHSESVGTQMTDTWTVQQSGSTVAILVTPGVGSLMTPSTFNCKWGIVKMNSNGPATVTPN